MRILAAALLSLPMLVMMATVAGQPPSPEAGAKPGPRPLYTYREEMVPVRDGVHLQTVIMVPLDARGPLPILLRRTPYGVPEKPYTEIPESLVELAADGYILVVQNLRGRFKSEGTFSLSDDIKLDPGRGTIETRDAWDTIDWLVKNVPESNGRVGIFGVSYDGYTAAATLLDPHPALKAVSEQASPVDEWMNDDDHRYGALRLSYDFEYAVLEEADKNANTNFEFDRWDTYDWYLAAGPLSTLNDKYLHGKIGYWNNTLAHPDYDAFWKQVAWIEGLHRSSVPNLNVAGFWDQEDPWGPWQIFRHAAENDPGHTNLIAAGPWYHGAWRHSVSSLGPIPLGQDTAQAYRQLIEAPFFAYWLHDKGSKPEWSATIFQTGTNRWRTYQSWPPQSTSSSLYFHADGSLSFDVPTASERGAHRDYISDPANPVPYRQRPISPTYEGGDWPTWESADQRFVDHRPDVLTYVSAPLAEDLSIAGPVSAELYASTSGTDSDFVVKLIDEFPEVAQDLPWDPAKGPAPGKFAQTQNGYQLPIAMEVRRGRYLASFEHANPLQSNQPVKWDFPLRDRDHVFRAGHRIMVQVQSTWFPLIDRNPQTFTSSIYTAKASDFAAATQKVYSTPTLPSRVILPVVPSGGTPVQH
jgi:putative CocE/NonD family hydrolase